MPSLRQHVIGHPTIAHAVGQQAGDLADPAVDERVLEVAAVAAGEDLAHGGRDEFVAVQS